MANVEKRWPYPYNTRVLVKVREPQSFNGQKSPRRVIRAAVLGRVVGPGLGNSEQIPVTLLEDVGRGWYAGDTYRADLSDVVVVPAEMVQGLPPAPVVCALDPKPNGTAAVGDEPRLEASC